MINDGILKEEIELQDFTLIIVSNFITTDGNERSTILKKIQVSYPYLPCYWYILFRIYIYIYIAS